MEPTILCEWLRGLSWSTGCGCRQGAEDDQGALPPFDVPLVKTPELEGRLSIEVKPRKFN